MLINTSDNRPILAITTLKAAHHVDMQGFAEVHVLQQLQQPAPDLLGFEQQAVGVLHRGTHTQELKARQESQVLAGQMFFC